LPSFSFKVAFHGAGSGLWVDSNGGIPVSYGLGLNTGTSPSIAYLNTEPPAWPYAFQAEGTGALWENGASLGYEMAAGSSPSITPGSVVAFKGSTGTLWIYRPGLGAVNTGLGIEGGTSPYITEVFGGWEVAFHAAGSGLWTYSSAGAVVNTGLGMETGTSPGVGPLNGGGYIVAFAAAGTSDLWTFTSGNVATDLKVQVSKGTSPSITLRAEASWEAAFQTKTHELGLYTPILGALGTGRKMLAGSSPSIAA
jgi:hypothetical protein